MMIMSHKKRTENSSATHRLSNQIKVRGQKKISVKSRANHMLRNPMKIMGHKLGPT